MSTAIVEPTADYYVDAPTPGLYPGLPYDEYARWAAMNHSKLKHFGTTPYHGRYWMVNPDHEETKAQATGHNTHVAVLEPERFAKEYAVMPYMGKRQSSIVRKEEEDFRTAHAETTFLDAPEHELCVKLRDAVWAHPTARAILSAPGKNEVSAVWKDKVTGLPCKGRQDRVGLWDNWPVVVDFKTAEDAGRRDFSKAIATFGYHDQGAYYIDGLDSIQHFEGDRRYVFIVVEKDPPYAVAVYELDNTALTVGRRRYRANLDKYAACLESGLYPGYGDGADLITLPAWAMKEEEHY